MAQRGQSNRLNQKMESRSLIKTDREKTNAFNKVKEILGASFETDVIKLILETCNWNEDETIAKLIQLDQEAAAPKSNSSKSEAIGLDIIACLLLEQESDPDPYTDGAVVSSEGTNYSSFRDMSKESGALNLDTASVPSYGRPILPSQESLSGLWHNSDEDFGKDPHSISGESHVEVMKLRAVDKLPQFLLEQNREASLSDPPGLGSQGRKLTGVPSPLPLPSADFASSPSVGGSGGSDDAPDPWGIDMSSWSGNISTPSQFSNRNLSADAPEFKPSAQYRLPPFPSPSGIWSQFDASDYPGVAGPTLSSGLCSTAAVATKQQRPLGACVQSPAAAAAASSRQLPTKAADSVTTRSQRETPGRGNDSATYSEKLKEGDTVRESPAQAGKLESAKPQVSGIQAADLIQSTKERMERYSQSHTKILVIMRGLPGSGKSYLAANIQGSGQVFSTDDYFMRGGVYQFGGQQLHLAHEWNQKRVRKALEDGVTPVIVDNTNTQMWEMLPYAKMGHARGYTIELLEPQTPWRSKSHLLAKLNTHNVGVEAIKRMKERYEPVTIDALMRQVISVDSKDRKRPQHGGDGFQESTGPTPPVVKEKQATFDPGRWRNPDPPHQPAIRRPESPRRKPARAYGQSYTEIRDHCLKLLEDGTPETEIHAMLFLSPLEEKEKNAVKKYLKRFKNNGKKGMEEGDEQSSISEDSKRFFRYSGSTTAASEKSSGNASKTDGRSVEDWTLVSRQDDQSSIAKKPLKPISDFRYAGLGSWQKHVEKQNVTSMTNPQPEKVSVAEFVFGDSGAGSTHTASWDSPLSQRGKDEKVVKRSLGKQPKESDGQLSSGKDEKVVKHSLGKQPKERDDQLSSRNLNWTSAAKPVLSGSEKSGGQSKMWAGWELPSGVTSSWESPSKRREKRESPRKAAVSGSGKSGSQAKPTHSEEASLKAELPYKTTVVKEQSRDSTGDTGEAAMETKETGMTEARSEPGVLATLVCSDTEDTDLGLEDLISENTVDSSETRQAEGTSVTEVRRDSSVAPCSESGIREQSGSASEMGGITAVSYGREAGDSVSVQGEEELGIQPEEETVSITNETLSQDSESSDTGCGSGEDFDCEKEKEVASISTQGEQMGPVGSVMKSETEYQPRSGTDVIENFESFCRLKEKTMSNTDTMTVTGQSLYHPEAKEEPTGLVGSQTEIDPSAFSTASRALGSDDHVEDEVSGCDITMVADQGTEARGEDTAQNSRFPEAEGSSLHGTGNLFSSALECTADHRSTEDAVDEDTVSEPGVRDGSSRSRSTSPGHTDNTEPLSLTMSSRDSSRSASPGGVNQAVDDRRMRLNDSSLPASPRRIRRKKHKSKPAPFFEDDIKVQLNSDSWKNFEPEKQISRTEDKSALLEGQDSNNSVTIKETLSPNIEENNNCCHAGTQTEGEDFGIALKGTADGKEHYHIIKAKDYYISSENVDILTQHRRKSSCDSSTMVDISEEPSVDEMHKLFPGVAEAHLNEVLEVCHGDVNVAVELMLEWGITIPLTPQDKYQLSKETSSYMAAEAVDSDHSTRPVPRLFDTCIEILSKAGVDPQEIQPMVINSSEQHLKRLESSEYQRFRSMNSGSNKGSTSGFDLPQDFSLSSFLASGKTWYSESSSEPSETGSVSEVQSAQMGGAEESQKLPGVCAAVPEHASEGATRWGETESGCDTKGSMMLPLPAKLVHRLEALFGPLPMANKGPAASYTVCLDYDTAASLHQCIQQAASEEEIEMQLRRDEAYARWLQVEEKVDLTLQGLNEAFDEDVRQAAATERDAKLALALERDTSPAEAPENYAAKSQRRSVRYPPKVTVGNPLISARSWTSPGKPLPLRKIMQEEMEQEKLYEKQAKQREARREHSVIATRLKREKLQQQFPDMDKQLLEDLFEDQQYCLESTVRVVEDILKVRKPVSHKLNMSSRDSQMLSETAEDMAWTEAEDEVFQQLDALGKPSLQYKELRQEAIVHRKLAMECVRKARNYQRYGMGAVSDFYAKEGRMHFDKTHEAHMRASDRLFESRYEKVVKEGILDLHGFHVEEAIAAFKRVVKDKEKEFSRKPVRDRSSLTVITGRGKHSQDGVAKLRPAIKAHLESAGYKYVESKPGHLKVFLQIPS